MFEYHKETFSDEHVVITIDKYTGGRISNLCGNYILLEVEILQEHVSEGKIIRDNTSRGASPSRVGQRILFDCSGIDISKFSPYKTYLIIKENRFIANLD